MLWGVNRYVFDLARLAKTRAGPATYHLASEKHLRIQIFHVDEDEVLGEWEYAGDAVVMVIEGEAILAVEGAEEEMNPLCEAVIPMNHRFRIVPRGRKTAIQIIWSPPYAVLK